MNISDGDDGLEAILRLLGACKSDPSGKEVEDLMINLRSIARRHLPATSPLRNGFDSEDLAQEGVIQLIANLDRFRGKTIGEFLSFANAIINQQAAKQARWQKVRRSELRSFENVAEQVSDLSTPSTDAIKEEETKRAKMLVHELAEPYRETVLLRFEGKSYTEIADLLSVSEEVVRKRFSRALKVIQSQW
ncbi:RNA polymerase sigma factor [bacterium]|nr:RNA polymerase sigma factor [bacterium]